MIPGLPADVEQLGATPVMGLHHMRKAKPGAMDYVQDGLVAMWDGIENAGWGMHDSTATTWTDLTGNGHHIDFAANTLSGTITFAANCVAVSGSVNILENPIVMSSRPNSPPSDLVKYHTFEACVRYVRLNSANANQMFGCEVACINSVVDRFMPWVIAARSDGYWDIGCSRKMINPLPAPVGTAMLVSIVQNADTHQIYINGENCGFSDGGHSKAISTPIKFTYFTADPGAVGEYEIFGARLYSRALTAAEIVANHAIEKARFNLP